MILFLKHKSFDMIVNGEKKEEYREYKEYYTPRLNNFYNTFDQGIELRRGYTKTALKLECEAIYLYLACGDLFSPPETITYILGKFNDDAIVMNPEWGFDRTKDSIIFVLGKAK